MDTLPPDHWAKTGAYTPTIYRDQYPSIDPTSPALSQEGKVILITGASKGIGARGFALAFAKAKPRAIILVARNAVLLAETGRLVQAIHPEIGVMCFAASIDDEAAIARLYKLAAETVGHVDVLINNAGVGSPEAIGPFADIDPAKWWHEHGMNVKGTMLVTQGFLKLLGPERRGTIVTMNTLLSTAAMPGLSAYGSAKLASLRMMEYIAIEYPNVTAVSLQPGVVMTDAILGDFKRFALDTPELVGGTGVWLTTEAARFLSGRFISANWSVDDLVARRAQIESSQDLKIIYSGRFGLDQFMTEAAVPSVSAEPTEAPTWWTGEKPASLRSPSLKSPSLRSPSIKSPSPLRFPFPSAEAEEDNKF